MTLRITSLVALLILLTLLVISACESASVAVPPPAIEGDYCRIATPIYYDVDKDTPETVAQIEKHNSKWVCVCEKDCPQAGSGTIAP